MRVIEADMRDTALPLPLQGIRVLTLALNLPGPVAVARLRALGAAVTKVEPLDGDPLAAVSRAWYTALHDSVDIVRLNLKAPDDRAALDAYLEAADVLVTSSRPAALARLGLTPAGLLALYPRLAWVAIVGRPAPHENAAGHDLTYQAPAGLLTPPHLPRALVADLAGAEQTVSAALALLFARERGRGAGYTQVALSAAAEAFADPLRYGLTAPSGVLGGGSASYNLYATKRGWVALAALEPHFWRRLLQELGDDIALDDHARLQQVFLARTAAEWETWAVERGLPLVAIHDHV